MKACVHIKPDEKNDITAKTTIANEACIGLLHESCYSLGKE